MIETVRLRMRPLQPSDLPALRGVWGDPEVMQFCGGAATDERLGQAVQRCEAVQAERGFSPFAVLDRADERLIGVCGLKSLPDPEGAELIYHFLPSAWGCGYATEAARAVTTWARETLPLHYVEASIDPRNDASRKVLLKAGFTFHEERWFEDVQQSEPVFRFHMNAPREGARP